LLVSAQLVDSPAARVDFALTSESPAGCHLEIVSGDGQIAAPGELLPAPLEIALRSGQGLPYPGQSVVFRVLTGGGTIGDQVSAEVTTDADGRAQAHWRLGETTGEQKIQVFVAEEREEQSNSKPMPDGCRQHWNLCCQTRLLASPANPGGFVDRAGGR
jgi:hypothetical protein